MDTNFKKAFRSRTDCEVERLMRTQEGQELRVEPVLGEYHPKMKVPGFFTLSMVINGRRTFLRESGRFE